MLRFCAIFNILTGLLGVLFCIGLSLLAFGLGGGRMGLEDVLELARTIGWIGLAGILYAWSGVVLWKVRPAVSKQAVVLIGCALGCGVLHCVQFMVLLKGWSRQAGERWDEEVVMLVFLPMAVLVVVAIQVAFLWRRARREG